MADLKSDIGISGSRDIPLRRMSFDRIFLNNDVLFGHHSSSFVSGDHFPFSDTHNSTDKKNVKL